MNRVKKVVLLGSGGFTIGTAQENERFLSALAQSLRE